MSHWKYLIQRHDGKEVSLWNSRHEAIGWKAKYHDANRYEIVPVSSLSFFHGTERTPDHENRVAGRGF